MKTFPTRLDLIRSLPPNSIGCEVGVLYGAFSEQILSTPVKTLHLVDPYKHYDGYGKDSMNVDQGGQDMRYGKLLDKFAGEIQSGRIVIHRRMSPDAVLDFEGTPLDWMYLDANHLYEYVLADLRAWATVIKPGGVIMGHDYGGCPEAKDLNFGVEKAVWDFCACSNWEMYALTEDAPISFALQRFEK